MMATGKIVQWDSTKGYGFIQDDARKRYFLHHSKWQSSGKPQVGMSVEFQAQQTDKGLNAIKAKLIIQAGNQITSDNKGQSALNPYHFVKLATNNTVLDTPIWHDGNNANQAELLSGEMRFTLTALTPLLVGQYQYKVQDTAQGTLPQPADVAPKKAILEPLRLPDGRVILAGTSLKGMLRNGFSALLSTPMERVAERSYSYRPNANFENELRGPRPALITAVDGDSVSVRVLETPTSVYFVRKNAENKFTPLQPGTLIDRVAGVIAKDEGRNKRIYANNADSLGAGYYAIYDGGIDGSGILHRKFKESQKQPGDSYHLVWIMEKDYQSGKDQILPVEVISHYLKTLDHLLDDNGHFASGYPGEGVDQAKVRIGILKNRWQTKRNDLVGRLIYVELQDGSQITSMGHHYYYRWRYANTIRTIWQSPDKSAIRAILAPLAAELKQDGIGRPQDLNATRLLFGYTSRKETDPLQQDGMANIGDKDFQRLAGRIHINSAVEICEGDTKDNSRFLKGADLLDLKPLGQPRPSAVEHYLAQPDPDNLEALKKHRKDGGNLLTYGDLPGQDTAPSLAGRKFYLHQPDAANDASCYTTGKDDHIKGEQAMIARFVSKPNTTFRFTVRFKDLRPWEIGALLVVLEPEKYLKALLTGLKQQQPQAGYLDRLNAILAKLDNYTGKQPLFAHKLGHARPLGLGSVQLTCDAIHTLTAKDGLPEFATYTDSRHAIAALAQKLGQQLKSIDHLAHWCAVHQYAGRTRSDYPSTDDDIFKHHSKIRTDHIAARRLSKDEGKVSDKLLKPLDFNPK